MPIPYGARQVPGNKNRVQLSSGEVVTRHAARQLGARELGYTNDKTYRSERDPERDSKHFAAWSRGRQGQSAIDKEKATAKAEGRRYSPARVRQGFLAARNDRPRKGRPGGQAFLRFVERYDLDQDDWLNY